MNQINRYIMRQLTSVTVFATVVLCITVILVQSIRLVDLIVNRGLPIGEFAYMASLMVPRFIALVMPIALFGAMIFTYNRMINDSELVVMRSSGMGTAALAKPGLIVGFICSMICLSMTLFMMPVAAQEMRFHVEKNRSQWGASLLHEGKFTTIGSDITLFVKERQGNELFGLFYHNQKDPDASYTIMAERGAVINTDNGPKILVFKGNRQSFQNGRIHKVDFDRTSIDIGGPSAARRGLWVQPEERFIHALFYPDLSDSNDRYYYGNLIAEGHSRLATALLPISYTFIALGFVLGSGFSRKGNPGSVIGATVAMVLTLTGHMSSVSASGQNPFLISLIYINAFIPITLGTYFILRSRTHKVRERQSVPA